MSSSADGNLYEGEFKDGKCHGRGTEKFANGDVYEGEYKDGKRHGLRTYAYADRDVSFFSVETFRVMGPI